MRLFLIRHARSKHSIQQRISNGASCPGLTEDGLGQARLLKERLQRTGELSECRAFFSSPVLRARQTAAEIAAALPALPLETQEGLTEIAPGQAEGLTWSEYQASFDKFDLVAEPDRPFAPGGESWNEYLSRVKDLHQRLAQRYAGQTVAAVTHAGFIVASLIVTFNIPRPGTGARIEPAYTSITEWQVDQDAWLLLRFNDSAHLLMS